MNKDCPVCDFKEFMTEGEYRAMKQHEAFLKQAKEHLRNELHPLPGKRHEFRELNMVAKFVAVEVRSVDHEGLINELFDYVRAEQAVSLLTLDEKRMKEVDQEGVAAPFLMPKNYFVRPFFNKAGKSYSKTHDYLFGGQSVEDLLTEIRVMGKWHEIKVSEYERLKERLSNHQELIDKNKISTPFGSISRIANKPSWDMAAIVNEVGEDFISTFGQVKLSELDDWVLTGVIPKSIVMKHRTVKDIRLDFVVMQLDVEDRIMNMVKRQRSEKSLRHA